MLLRNPYQGGLALPAASFVSASHNTDIIPHFIEVFQNNALKQCGLTNIPEMLMIDHLMAMMDAVLEAFAMKEDFDIMIDVGE